MNRNSEELKKLATRYWCGTQFNLDFDWEELIENKTLTYVAYGVERCPTTDRPHHQYWCRFRKLQKSYKKVGAMLGKADVNKMLGSFAQNEAYANKDGDYHELGVKPSQGERNDLKSIMQDIKKGLTDLEIVERAPQKWCQYRRSFTAYRALLEVHRDWKPDVRVWWGTTGTGKSHDAIAWLDNDYDAVKHTETGFFIGYENNPNVLFDDFTPGMMPRDIFLTMADKYRMTANVKGSTRKWNPRKIAITSNYDPKTWYNDDAIMRRINKITKKTVEWKKVQK